MRLIICLFLLAAVGIAETPAKEKKKSPEELLEIAVGGMPMALQAVGLMDLAGLPQWSPRQATALRVRASAGMVAVRDLVVAKLVAEKRMEEEVGCWSGGGRLGGWPRRGSGINYAHATDLASCTRWMSVSMSTGANAKTAL